MAIGWGQVGWIRMAMSGICLLANIQEFRHKVGGIVFEKVFSSS